MAATLDFDEEFSASPPPNFFFHFNLDSGCFELQHIDLLQWACI